MFRKWTFLLLAAGAIFAGCSKATDSTAKNVGGGPGTDQPTNIAAGDPKVVVAAFLEAMRTGDDDKALVLLSKTARQKAIETKRSPAPKARETARFEVGDVEKIGEDGARVSCTWTDLDETGKPRSDHALWICRSEPEGWRVCGVAAFVFAGEDPLLLNFEDPDDMEKRQKWLQEEIVRRSKQPQDGTTPNVSAPVEAERKPQDAFRR
jgi:hypothetical protein